MTAAEAAALRASARTLGVDVPDEALERLDRFLAVLETWNRRIRLTGERDRSALIAKHVVDSLALLPYLPADGPIADIGSGAGFPGIILSCLRPALEVVLIEPRRRPVSFLREVLRTIPLPATRVLEMRAEAAARDPALGGHCRAVVARAIRFGVFVTLAAPFVAPAGVAIAMQTPRTGIASAAPALAVRETHDYRLPGGEERRLVVLGRPRE
jgi:16S rRNA (guanine527-N7)-methyltransferase